MQFPPDIVNGTVWVVNKPLEWTSFDVVNKIRFGVNGFVRRHPELYPQYKDNQGKLGIKVGHAGTLDPLATGVLVICVGKAATKNIDTIQAQEKEYTGTIKLGATTPTYDSEMDPDALFPWEHITKEMALEAAQQLTGELQQRPPIYSAVKIDGKRSYQMARSGKDFEISPKTVTVKEFEIVDFRPPEVNFRIVCSKGTYIRSLAHDFGKQLNSGGYLTALCRTKVGEYVIKDAIELKNIIDLLTKQKKENETLS
jgi:tRNA pseudouridine55 synthase